MHFVSVFLGSQNFKQFTGDTRKCRYLNMLISINFVMHTAKSVEIETRRLFRKFYFTAALFSISILAFSITPHRSNRSSVYLRVNCMQDSDLRGE